MPPANASQRFSLVEPGSGTRIDAFAEEVEVGLSATPKRLACRFLYDAVGSELFEEICELPEYYLTRAEREILSTRAAEIATCFEAPVTLVELGSGSASKTRLLIESFLRRTARCATSPSTSPAARSRRALGS